MLQSRLRFRMLAENLPNSPSHGPDREAFPLSVTKILRYTSDKLPLSGMTAAKLGNPTGEPVPLAALGGDLAEVSKKRRCFVICDNLR